MMKKCSFYAEMLPKCQKKTHQYENDVIDYYTCGTKKMYVCSSAGILQ